MRSLLPGKAHFLPSLFLCYLHMAFGENGSVNLEQKQTLNGASQSVPCDNNTDTSSAASGDGAESPKVLPDVFVIQTPAAVKVLEGSKAEMECLLSGMTGNWYINWFKNGANETLTNTTRRSIITSKAEKRSLLILNKTERSDSGIYNCISGNLHITIDGNGTQLIVDGITDLMVNQTPEYVDEPEGNNVTIVCQFKTVSDYNSTDVRWFRNGKELNSAGDSLGIELNLEKGFTSLTLTKAAVTDSGNYTCQVESRSRNLTGSGTASRVAITAVLAPEDKTEHGSQQGTSLAVVAAGVGTGVAIFLLLVAVITVWKFRTKAIRSESEMSPGKDTGLHPPLVSRPSEVTYADLHFHKREVRPDAAVVYAEVRAPRKQQARKEAEQMRHTGNQRR